LSLEGGYSKHKHRFVDNNRINFFEKFEPLKLDNITDIDSILESINERILYSGNVVLGNSKEVYKSASIINSF